jgi:hypothetical protein
MALLGDASRISWFVWVTEVHEALIASHIGLFSDITMRA